jgi:uncharacterized protein YecE (DUF72 family)
MPVVPNKFSSSLRIGTCSWKYDSWKGLIYNVEKNYKPDDYLRDYAQHYNTVEIDQWFWSLFPIERIKEIGNKIKSGDKS